MASIQRMRMTRTFRKVIRRILRDDKFYAAVKIKPKIELGYNFDQLTKDEQDFLKVIGKTNVKTLFDKLKADIETTRPARPPAWI